MHSRTSTRATLVTLATAVAVVAVVAAVVTWWPGRLRRMAEAAREAGARVWIIGPPPIGASWLRSVAPLATAAERVAADTGATYVPVEGLVGPTGEWREGLSWDGVHPTPAGARALADAILAALD